MKAYKMTLRCEVEFETEFGPGDEELDFQVEDIVERMQSDPQRWPWVYIKLVAEGREMIDKILRRGWEGLTEAELLGLVLSDQVAGSRLYARFGSLEGLCNQPMERLEGIEGVGEAKALRVGACYEIARRFGKGG